MENQTIIESIGSITKVEDVKTLNNNILPNTLVLEIEEYFPGYHGANLPTDSFPWAFYFVTKNHNSTEKIIRSTMAIQDFFPVGFDATSANIKINNEILPCIRIRGLKSYEHLSNLQMAYIDEGFTFRKKRKINASGVIEIKKHFHLRPYKNDSYLDLCDPQMCYFEVPKKLNWEHFKGITKKVKNNIDNNNFDVALGIIYLKRIIDVIRIYANDITPEQMEVIKAKYLAEIKV